jgi:serine/threonine protein kinase
VKDAFMNKKLSINDFVMGRNLGEGKFGTVYQAFEKKAKSVYALKKIPKSTIKSHWMIDQFVLEVKIQQFCNHPNILSLHGVFDDADNVYILLEYMEEGTLFLHLKKNATLN